MSGLWSINSGANDRIVLHGAGLISNTKRTLALYGDPAAPTLGAANNTSGVAGTRTHCQMLAKGGAFSRCDIQTDYEIAAVASSSQDLEIFPARSAVGMESGDSLEGQAYWVDETTPSATDVSMTISEMQWNWQFIGGPV
jgi:hypothetical protein